MTSPSPAAAAAGGGVPNKDTGDGDEDKFARMEAWLRAAAADRPPNAEETELLNAFCVELERELASTSTTETQKNKIKSILGEARAFKYCNFAAGAYVMPKTMLIQNLTDARLHALARRVADDEFDF